MFKGISDLTHLVKEAGKLKEKMEAVQDELAGRVVEASSGGGMVTASVNGRQEIVSIRIEKEIVDSGDAAMLQDLVAAACNAALSRSRDMMRDELLKVTGGLNIPLPGLT